MRKHESALGVYRYRVDVDRYTWLSVSLWAEDPLDFDIPRPPIRDWTEICYDVQDTPNLFIGDFVHTVSGTPILSPRAWEALRPLIRDVVVPLPIYVRNRPGCSPVTQQPILEADGMSAFLYYALQPLVYLDAIDLEHSDYNFNDVAQRITSFPKVALKKSVVAGRHLFRAVPEHASARVFVSEEFARHVRLHDLKGLKLEPVSLV